MAPKVVMSMADFRLEILLEPERIGATVKEVCKRNGISRDTFYRWKRRVDAVGIAGLLDRSTVPIGQPRRITPELEELICSLRRGHPRWGARTIRSRMIRGGLQPPSIPTIHRALKRNDLVNPQPRKKPRSTFIRFERPVPNDLWQMDDTEVELNSGERVKVLSIIDDHARFLLATAVCTQVTGELAWELFTTAASTYGLPRQLLSDNAIALTGRLRNREVFFERRMKAIGVGFIHGRPYHPQTQGKIERCHQTLLDWIEDAGGAMDVAHLERIVAAFRDDYNNDRPHQSLDDATPAERFRPSHILFDAALKRQAIDLSPRYPDGASVRKADSNGVLGFNHLLIALGREWAHHKLRVETEDDRIRVFFGDQLVRDFVPDISRKRQPLPRPGRTG